MFFVVDVLIVGFGLVGVMVVNLFVRYGVWVLVVEKFIEIFMVFCVIVFDNEVLCIL